MEYARPPMRFQPRQSHYLRVSPYTVLQFILYMEPAHVHWMTEDRLMRLLSALRERIPTKLRNEQELSKKKSSSREKQHIDVYRADYQMLFYFRKMGKKHVVLHKHDRRRVYPISSMPPPPVPKRSKPTVNNNKRSRAESETVDLSGHEHNADEEDEDEEAEPRPRKRTEVEADIVIKDEDDEQDVHALLEGATGEAGSPDDTRFVEDDAKPDVKPEIQVQYKGYSIYNRALVVVIEPWPALSAADLPRPSQAPSEIRQLSATPLPDRARAGSSSVTPAPPSRRGGLFRSSTTPLEGDDDLEYGGSPRRDRRESTVGSVAGMSEVDESEEELPTLDQLLRKK